RRRAASAWKRRSVRLGMWRRSAALLALQLIGQLHRLGRREVTDDLAVDPDLGRVVAGTVALAHVQPELVVRRALADVAADELLQDGAHTGAALDIAGGAAAPGDNRVRRRCLTKF